jgi:hypothetical protein
MQRVSLQAVKMRALPQVILAVSLLFACAGAQNPLISLIGRPELRLYIKNNCPTPVRVIVGGDSVAWGTYVLHAEPTFDGNSITYWVNYPLPPPGNSFIIPAGGSQPKVVLDDNSTSEGARSSKNSKLSYTHPLILRVAKLILQLCMSHARNLPFLS